MQTKKYFGTDGIRGRVGEYPITPDFMLRLGMAAGKILKDQTKDKLHPQVIIGKDTRVSGYMIESVLEAGFSASGVDVMMCGPLPTPGIAYLTRALRADLGIVISASHNLYADNGIKFFSKNGDKLPDAWELEVEAAIDAELHCLSSEALGKVTRIDSAQGRYIEFCKATFPNYLSLQGFHIVVDCANGATYHVAPDVYRELGAQVTAVANHPDGFNINQDCGATALTLLKDTVLAKRADLGVALDGDGDRLQMIDAQGHSYDGDALLYLLALQQKPQGVVGTLMSNFALEKALRKQGIGFERAKVGDRYVLEKLYERAWTLGGESSGHLLCLDKHNTGDAIIASLQVLSALLNRKETLATILRHYRPYPQTLINVRVKQAAAWQTHQTLQRAVAEVEKILTDTGRVLIRASGTEPVLRVMVEAHDRAQSQFHAEQLAALCRQLFAE